MPVKREILSDGKAAIRVDGHPASPLWFRVRLLDKSLRYGASGEPPELLVKVSAYQVDSSGAVIPGGEGPILRQSITAESLALGAQSMINERKSIAKQAIEKAVRSLVDIGNIAQLPTELVD